MRDHATYLILLRLVPIRNSIVSHHTNPTPLLPPIVLGLGVSMMRSSLLEVLLPNEAN